VRVSKLTRSKVQPVNNAQYDFEDEATRKKRAAALELERADVAWLMSGRRGRRIVWRLLESAGVFATSFRADALSMAFAEGCRNEGLRLLAQVHALPEYATMIAERAAQQANDIQHNEDQDA
jgi:hypothetical protein